MEFNEKLQELRRKSGLTQEELAAALFVSRTAVSKWESGRGIPNIESLKAISKYFSVPIDNLLSGEEILTIAAEDGKNKEEHMRDLVFGALDCCAGLLLFLPLFAQRGGDVIREVSLLSLEGAAPYIKMPYLLLVFGTAAAGILFFALQNCKAEFWVKNKRKISLCISAAAVVLFVLTLQPYATVFVFALLAAKSLMLIKRP